jgi:hypothetical protein
VHIDTAVRVLDAEEADAIDRALEGLGCMKWRCAKASSAWLRTKHASRASRG